MPRIEREIDRILSHLRDAISGRGFTQMEVQNALGWGRSYISQLLTGQKSLRFDQILMILNVIGVEPRAFFGGIYGAVGRRRPRGLGPDRAPTLPAAARRSMRLLDALVSLLEQKSLITASELSSAVEKAGREGSR